MRYPCVGFPSCLKTFENGHVLRCHQLSCEHARKELSTKSTLVEHARAIRFDCNIDGIKGNQFYPTFTGLDQTDKYYFRDRFQLGGPNPQPFRPLRQPPDAKLVTTQGKSTVMDFSGYYT